MTDLDRALADINAMRRQMAHATQFRGYGPAALAATGALAIVAALAQPHLVPDPTANVTGYLALWTATAVASAMIIGLEAVRRSRQAHGGLADDLLQAAAEQFLPAALAGVLMTAVLQRSAPEALWMLPGLWQIVLSLGMFAACRSLPGPITAVAVWYLVAGLGCLALAHGANAFSPWAMGLPFGVGQTLAAILLAVCFGAADDNA